MLKRGLIFAIGLFLVSCSGEDKTVEPVVPSSFELKRSDFSALAEWEKDDFRMLGKALGDVCGALQKMRQQSLKSGVLEYSLVLSLIHI